MSFDSILLLITILLPLGGAVLLAIASIANPGRPFAREVAAIISGICLVLVGIVVSRFPADGNLPAGGFGALRYSWLPPEMGVHVSFSLALDGLGLWLFCLTPLLLLTAVLVSWEAISQRTELFFGMLLLLAGGCLGVFAARDLILFYVFFEFTLIPLFFLIGVFGSEDRRYAAYKFFLFTLAGSLLTFLGLLAIVLWVRHATLGDVFTFSIPDLVAALAEHPIPANMQFWIFLALFAGFAIKVPLFPLHTWLPLAHVQAPTAGSVFLAGVLLKIGTYGFVRFSMPMLPEATAVLAPWLLWLAVVGIIYGALVALAQKDMKRLIAYSSVSHLGFCMIGLFALNRLGLQGGTLQMVNHGLSTGALFAIIGMLYERYHTREIADYGGLARRLPVLTFFMLLFTFSSIGLPGLNGFAGEFLLMLGMFQRAFAEAAGPVAWQLQVIALVTVFGVVLGAWYMLYLVRSVFFGPLKEPAGAHGPVADLSQREVLALLPLAVFVFWIGLWPQFFLARMQPTLNQVTEIVAEPAARHLNPQVELTARKTD
jgi:NADH-quinone oxidoreductase subunit M